MDLSTTLVVASIIVFVIYWLNERRKNKLPPGPYGLPFVGYIPFLTSKPYLTFQKLAKRYGPVFSLKLGSQTVIVLNDYPSIKTAFMQDAFSGRPPETPFVQSPETFATDAINGLPWKEQKRFALHVLRDLGFGKSRMEEHLRDEIKELIDHLEKFNGEPMEIRPIISPSISNNIATLMYGKRLKYDDPTRVMFDTMLREVGKAAGQTIWEIFFPSLAKVAKFFGFGGAAKIDKVSADFRTYNENQVKEHEETLDENNIRDFIDGYLIEMRKRNDRAFNKHTLQDVVGAFFGGGSETVKQSLSWLLLIMATKPDVQEKVLKEIHDVIGRDRLPTWNDKLNMPYTDATIMETLRWRTIIPVNLIHYTLWASELNGYYIPKSSFVISNIWGVHHNTEYWGNDAHEHRVERCLSDDGKEVKKSDYFIPFSIGKRSCPGETLARIEIFLYFVSLVQKFKVSLPEGTIPDLEGELGAGLMPKPHKFILKKRD